ncbi:hypothetical protein [Streptomyces venezuelae]|uniref:hypothetical protein n=1 Tax=Streptomyces venezuelae TaxID=54571 RepID=UPI00351B43EC
MPAVHGEQGWEVESLDSLGRFVGWELCGEWLVYGYFKRPRAATAGPAGALDARPAAPLRWLFLSRRGKVAPTLWAVIVGGAMAACFIGTLGTGGLAITIALASSFSALFTAQLETTKGRVEQGRAERDKPGRARLGQGRVRA